jgi:hypothetical protein
MYSTNYIVPPHMCAMGMSSSKNSFGLQITEPFLHVALGASTTGLSIACSVHVQN